ncbi:polyprenyl synthetase family protein [Pseudonocardia sp. EV170527-09]|uniref:polyprenyl synthetase family protein n=1 Tax=Pseudonocardia sp. EV170527-09 TaxID=2603411 RepID=UPI001EFFBC9A|nr:polyprenyl synthetase family protein [Pseudonocardia sp. EV170527-09]
MDSSTAVYDARQVLGETQELIAPALQAAVAGLPVSTRDLVEYHFGWRDTDDAASTIVVGGKMVRATLAVLACQAVGGSARQAIEVALAVELVHNASLIHDDIIDGDVLRRHRPTVWATFGIPAAILAGDALFFLANHLLANAPPLVGSVGGAWLNEAGQSLVAGEYVDSVLPDHPEVTMAEAVAVAEAKTGALIGVACALGALAGGADPAWAGRLRVVGQHLGLAFQLVDDLLGIWGPADRTGKPERSDLRSRKRSLPVVAALTSQGPAAHDLARLYQRAAPLDQRAAPLDEHELPVAAGLVDSAGGRAWAHQQAEQHLTAALAALHCDGLAPAAVAKLTTLAQFITHRDH